MLTQREINNALEYYSQKLPSVERNENAATVAAMRSIVATLEYVLGKTERI